MKRPLHVISMLLLLCGVLARADAPDATPADVLSKLEREAMQGARDLKIDRIAVAMNRVDLEMLREQATGKARLGARSALRLKQAYEKAEAAGQWPMEWKGKKRDREWARSQLVTLGKAAKVQEDVARYAGEGIARLDEQSERIEVALGSAEQQLTEIASTRELLKVQAFSGELKDRLEKVQVAVAGVVKSAGESGKVISLDDLARKSSAGVKDQDFEKVYNGIK